jgi:hypothetical protein
MSDEPFILASQASQVFYVPDLVDTDWVAVVQPKPRDLYVSDDTQDELLDADNGVNITIPDLNPSMPKSVVAGRVPCARIDIDGIIVSGVKYGNKSRK